VGINCQGTLLSPGKIEPKTKRSIKGQKEKKTDKGGKNEGQTWGRRGDKFPFFANSINRGGGEKKAGVGNRGVAQTPSKRVAYPEEGTN